MRPLCHLGSSWDLSIVALTLIQTGGLLDPPSLKSWILNFKLWSRNLATFPKNYSQAFFEAVTYQFPEIFFPYLL